MTDAFAHLDEFKAMMKDRRAQINPSWHRGFGAAVVPFYFGLLCIVGSWANWGRESVGEVEHDPLLTLIFGIALVAIGLARRDVRVRVPLYGVVVDGVAEGIDWPDRWSMERREANRDAILATWQKRHPTSKVELLELWDAWVYVPRDMVEHAGAKSLVSR